MKGNYGDDPPCIYKTCLANEIMNKPSTNSQLSAVQFWLPGIKAGFITFTIIYVLGDTSGMKLGWGDFRLSICSANFHLPKQDLNGGSRSFFAGSVPTNANKVLNLPCHPVLASIESIVMLGRSHRRVIALVAVGVVRRRRADQPGLPSVPVAVRGRLLRLVLLLLLLLLGALVLVDVVEVEVVLDVGLLRLIYGV